MYTQKSYDLAVAGGGTASTLCAIAAARSGLSTVIIERNTYLGGMSTGAGLAEMNAVGRHGSPLYHGVEKEIFDALIREGYGKYDADVPMSSNPGIRVDRLRYHPAYLQLLLEETARASGVTIFYETELLDAKEADDACLLSLRRRDTAWTLTAAYMADATGNAALAQKAGAETTLSPASERLTASLLFQISNADAAALQTFLHSGALANVVDEGFRSGALPGKILSITPIPGTHDVSVNATRVHCDEEDAASYAEALSSARRQILPIHAFLQKHVPGLSDSRLSAIAPLLGVRDARRICGAYTLTLKDLLHAVRFPDCVADGCYPMDLHDPGSDGVVWQPLPDVYHIPYRCLLPRALHRTLAVGKCLSAETRAFAAVRVMPIMMNVGESAGYAFALAAQTHAAMDSLSAQALTAWLDAKYMS